MEMELLGLTKGPACAPSAASPTKADESVTHVHVCLFRSRVGTHIRSENISPQCTSSQEFADETVCCGAMPG